MSTKKYISKIHKGSDDLFVKDSEARTSIADIYTLLDNLTYKDVYIGKGVNYTSVMVAGNHHDVIVKGDHVNMTCNNSKVWIILNSTNSAPLLTMSGIEIPMTAGADVTVDEVTYKVYSSTNTYTGTFNVFVF